MIDYPDLPRKQYKFHAVDFIPKKRHEDDIMHELDKERRKPLVSYGKRGVDRNAMIEELQEIHRFGDKKVMDKALAMEQENRELAKLRPAQLDNKQRLRSKYASQNAKNAMKHYEEKFGMNPADFLLNQPTTANQIQTKQDEELHDLFDQIIYEIEDRQQHLEDITKGGTVQNKQVETQMKKEIVDRIAELQKIKELQMKSLKWECEEGTDMWYLQKRKYLLIKNRN